MGELPTGTVTFLFTDIEGSTQLLKQLRERYETVLDRHQQILRDSFAARGGREVDTQGDSFFVAFARAGDAVSCAVDAQRALQNYPWPDGARVRVRMGLHSGEPRAAGERYVGFGVHRAARIGAVGHGGQILVSNATRELVEDELPSDTRLRDLGSYELKDLDRPEHLFQVDAEGLPYEFPPLKAPRLARPHRLRRISLVLGLVALVGAGVAIAIYRSNTSQAAVGSPENPITVLTTWDDTEVKAFDNVLRPFETTTGFETRVEGVESLKAMRERLAAEELPMLAMIPSPGLLADLADRGIAKPLAALGISDEYLARTYGEHWVDLGKVDAQTFGLPAKASSKSLFWYRPVDFVALGLSVPVTWAQLLSTTKQIEAAGETPWALGAADSWTLTDWFENIYIRTAGPDRYSQLFAGELPFDHPSVIAALRRMTAILNDRFVAGGVTGALGVGFGDAIGFVFGPAPRAHLYMEGGFVGSLALDFIKPRLKPGETIDAAPFPVIDPRYGNPVVGGGDLAVALADNEQARDLLRYLSTPGAARIWVSTGGIVSLNKRVPLSAYPNTLVRAQASQMTRAKVFRFDGSDLLPGSLSEKWGSTLQRVLQRPDDTPELVAAFERRAAPVLRR